MFTGIIEEVAKVMAIRKDGSNLNLSIKSQMSPELNIDQSIAHNGICLTVTSVNIKDGWHEVSAISETIAKTNLKDLRVGDWINLERAMQLGDRLDGHIVQGHIDTTAKCAARKELEGSVEYTFDLNASHGGLLVEKGSITVNGVSLTLKSVMKKSFEVAIIPYTLENTNFKHLNVGTHVNIEFDILGKYILNQARFS